jgi:hypothetical protein
MTQSEECEVARIIWSRWIGRGGLGLVEVDFVVDADRTAI